MNVSDLMVECARLLKEVTGHSTFPYPPATISAPAGYVSYPASVDYDETYGRGMDRIVDLPIVMVVGKATAESARTAVGKWSAGGGPGAVKAVFERHSWAACEDLTITTCRFETEEIAGVPYLTAVFLATAVGSGGSA